MSTNRKPGGHARKRVMTASSKLKPRRVDSAGASNQQEDAVGIKSNGRYRLVVDERLTPQAPDDEVSTSDLGARIRKLRLRRGISLRQAAQRAQVAPSFLSQVELSQVAPSITSLRRLSAALDTSIVELLQDEDGVPQRSVVRANARHKLIAPGQTAQIEMLAEAPGRPFEMLLVRLLPKQATSAELQSHAAKECVYVLSGRVRTELGETSETLKAGDSIFFAASTPHRFVNIGTNDAFVISCIAGEM